MTTATGCIDTAHSMAAHLHGHLRRIARRHLARECRWQALEPTALVNEAYLRMARQRRLDPGNEEQFLGLASRCMRRVLLDDGRRRRALKRSEAPVDPRWSEPGAPPRVESTLPIREGLSLLAVRRPRAVAIVRLRFFDDLTVEEIAGRLELSPATVKRELRSALDFLKQCLGG